MQSTGHREHSGIVLILLLILIRRLVREHVHLRCGCAQVIPVSNFKCLFGAHERLLNNLVKRFDEGLIDDFYVYASASSLDVSLSDRSECSQFGMFVHEHSCCHVHNVHAATSARPGRSPCSTTASRTCARSCASCSPPRRPTARARARRSIAMASASAQRRTRPPGRSRSSRAGYSTRTSWYSHTCTLDSYEYNADLLEILYYIFVL